MSKNTIFLLCIIVFGFGTPLSAQNAVVEGYVFEANNRGYLNLVDITVTEVQSQTVVNRATTDTDGFFSVQLPVHKDYLIEANKDIFQTAQVTVSTRGVAPNGKVFTKIKMNRKAGYLFDVTLAEKWDGKSQVDAIEGALIEIYNNTKEKEALVLPNHPNPYFKYTFEKGNHYTVMIRKKGYFTKRMEAYVDIKGCILCFDGLDEVAPAQPGASDNLTAGNDMGTIVANVELMPIRIGEGMVINNIYYDLAKWDIRPDAAAELDKLIVTLQSNPALIVELGSHTDARGSDSDNMRLSEKRAQSAVDYILKNSTIDPSRISARGYGETELVNKCADGVKCSEQQHQKNRRTELKIVGMLDIDPFDGRSLASIIEAENFEKNLLSLENQEVIKIGADEELPEEIRRQIEGKTASPPVSTTQPPTPTHTPTPPSTKPSETVATHIPPPSDAFKDEQTHNFEFVEETPTPSTSTAPAAPSVRNRTEYEVSTQHINRPPKLLDPEYSGYKIEFLTAMSELPLSHEIFSKHGNIIIERLKDGRYAYLLGDFQNKKNAQNFVYDVMQRLYTHARVVKYVNGRRTSR